MKGEAIIRGGWIALGLLFVTAMALSLEKPSLEVNPEAVSFAPGGASALAELLRQENFQVSITPAIPISPSKDVLQVEFVDRGAIEFPLEDQHKERPTHRFGQTTPSTPTAPSSVVEASRFLSDGGRALILEYGGGDLPNAPSPLQKVTGFDGQKYTLAIPPGTEGDASIFNQARATFGAWTIDGTSGLEQGESSSAFAKIESVGNGQAIVVSAGEMGVNGLIDQADNARFITDLAKRLAPPSHRIEIIDGAVTGNANSSLIDVLPSWVRGAWNQLLLLCLVIVFTLGKRFGLADETVPTQRSSRELVDGISDALERGRAAQLALKLHIKTADRALRRHLKLANDAPTRKRNELLPPSLAETLSACEHAALAYISSSEGYELSRRLETEVDHFLGRSANKANRGRRRVKSH